MTKSARKQPLLVVEDNLDQQVLLHSIIQRTLANTTPIFTASADEALTYLTQCIQHRDGLPRLVLLDLYLPTPAQGWQFLRAIKEMPPSVRPSVVVMSISQDAYDIEQAYQLGATSYIAKPIGDEAWLTCFDTIRQYWWETVTLPNQ